MEETSDRVGERFAAFSAQLDWLGVRIDALEVGPVLPGRWCWRDARPAAAQALWVELSAWVDWLVERYGVGELLPPCWNQHGAMVEELTALYAGWHAAYRDVEARGFDPLAWHEGLNRALGRLREWDTARCRDGEHRNNHVPWSGSRQPPPAV